MSEKKINKIINELREFQHDFECLSQAYCIAADLVPSPGSTVCKNNSALFEFTSIQLGDLLSEVKALLDRSGDDFSKDGERPGSGGAE